MTEPLDSTPVPLNSSQLIQPVHHLTFTHKELEKIRSKLLNCMDSLSQNPSVVSQIAQLWSSRPWWQKIGLGSLLVVPLLLTGLIVHIAVLTALSLSLLIYFTLSSWLLDNHHHNQNTHSQEMKITILSLVNILATLIQELQSSSQELTEEIQHLHDENKQLDTHSEELEKQIKELSSSITALTQQELLLCATQKSLESTVVDLQDTISTQTDLLKKNQTALTQSNHDYEELQKKLAKKITELSDVKVSMELQVKKAKLNADALNQAVQLLSSSVITDAKQRASFHERLTGFLNNAEIGFDKIAERVCATERKLALVTNELEESQRHLQELIDRQEQQVVRLEKTGQVKPSSPLNKSINVLASSGLFAMKQELPAKEVHEPHQLALAAG